MDRRIAAIWLSLTMLFGFVMIVVEVTPTVRATTIYVDDEPGEGPGNPAENYTSIQAAINASNDGDTVFVYNGTYHENLVVNKKIDLIGENRSNTIIDGGGNGNIVSITVSRVNLTEFNITNGWRGIYIESSSNISITENIIIDNAEGFFLDNANNNIISNNTIIRNNGYGISLSESSNNTIKHNNLSPNGRGISLQQSFGNYIIDNDFSLNNKAIYLYNSSKNNIKGNNLAYTIEGITLSFSSNNDISDNYIYSTTILGISLYSSTNNNISNNQVSENEYFGIYLTSSSGNIFTNNDFSNNRLGFYIDSSFGANITNNDFINDGIFVWGDQLSHFNTHTIENNFVNGKSLVYYKNSSGIKINGGSIGQLILANCTEFEVKNLMITNTIVGIWVAGCSNSSITSNQLSNNDDGIRLLLSSNNNITKNDIYSNNGMGISLGLSSNNNNIINNNLESNYYGIQLGNSFDNKIIGNNVSWNSYGIILRAPSINNIYHNNIIDSTYLQASKDPDNIYQWDNGYPYGGNYWSDYSGIDNFRGPGQNIPGSDGFGDTPYIVDSNNSDRYPLMDPYNYKPLDNYMILEQGWNLISIPFIQEEQNLTRVLGTIDGWYDAVQWYGPTDPLDPWKHHKVGKPFGNDLTQIDEKMGFWVHITQPGETIFQYNGTQPIQNQSMTLHPGWNLVGYPSLTSYNRTEALNNITFSNEVDSIWIYIAATQEWKEINEGDYFERGRGYWVHAKIECAWEIPL